MTMGIGGCRDFRLGEVSRRNFLRIGVVGALGPALPWVLRAEDAARLSDSGAGARGRGWGKARSIIFLHQFGGASHHDTFDMKPSAPEKVRGEFKPIASRLPGLLISEHLPRMSLVADKLCLAHSVQHTMGNHNSAGYYSLTGHKPPIDIVTANASATDFPAYGSVVDRFGPSAGGIPTAVSLPTMIADGPFRTPGEFAGFLGKKHDPLFITKDPSRASFRVDELRFPLDVPLDRAGDRKSLLAELKARSRLTDQIAGVSGMSDYQQRAFALLSSERAQAAFDLEAEEPKLRDRYGRTTYGQSVLLARRLVEAGVRFVTVYYSPGIGGWDTHKDNFNTLRNSRLPITDQTLSALLTDLDDRGLLDETMVVWTGEFGRTPKINADAGRDHWPNCYTIVMAGGGLKRGFRYGASDAAGAFPKEAPCSPDDIAATMFHALGIDPSREMRDQLDRPIPISYGAPLLGMFA